VVICCDMWFSGTKWLYTRLALCIAILVLLTTWPAVFTHAHISPIHTACHMVNGIEMSVHMADTDCSLFPLIIQLSVFAVCDDQVMADYMSNFD